MRNSRPARALRSIHTRLLLVILISGLAINALLLMAFLAHRYITADAFLRSVAQYVQYLAKDIGSPPDRERASEIAKRTGLNIYYDSPQTSWSTSGRPPAVEPDRLHTLYDQGPVQIKVFRGHQYLIHREGNDRQLLFEVVRNPAGDRRLHWVGVLLASTVTLLLVAAHFWIRHTIAPLRQLSRGVRELSLGHLDHRVPVARRDELGDLARTFNNMADRLQQLIRVKERMLRDVSHELRSPLTRMKVALEMGPEGNLKDSLSEDILDMERMVTAILESARTQSGAVSFKLERSDLVPLVKELARSHEHDPPGLVTDDLPESAWLLMDRDKVKTALRNVVDNAMKYSTKDSGPVRVRMIASPGQVTVEIDDQGIGIPAEDMPFIFEPFYRVDRSRSRETGGFGLGLSLCKAIMDAHGGSISVDSSMDKGTRVSLFFPAEGVSDE